VSAPVRTSDGDLVAAISISGPIERLGRNPGQRFAPVLVSGARRISATLAGS
jgi:DNA-binding IclR family transcriptional regulator